MNAAIETARKRALMAGLIGLAVCAGGAFFSPVSFFRAYLFAWVFWIGVSLGCLAVLMIQHITGGAWGLVIRRVLEAGARTLPFMALLYVPLLAGLGSLYPWARPETVAADPLLTHKAPYLNVPFFVARSVVYFTCWSALAWLLTRMSREQDETGDPRLVRRFQIVSAGGMLIFVLTMTFASVDWVMSLEPHWFSTIYGALLMAGFGVSAFCVVVAAGILLSRFEPLSNAITPGHLHDLAKLLFTFVLVWAYFALSQFLIIWSANLPEEIPWYLNRLKGGWEWIGLGVILLHFALPFGLLLQRRVKRSGRLLLRVALLVLVMRAVDLYWMMAPAFEPGSFGVHWMDLAAPIGLGGIWIHLFARGLQRAPLLPRRDPFLEEALDHGGE